jgi:hypothetical protein
MKIPTRPVHELSCDINQFLYEKDKGESLSALIISLSMTLKRQSKTYEEYLASRKTAISRVMDITELSEHEFKDTTHMFQKIQDAA